MTNNPQETIELYNRSAKRTTNIEGRKRDLIPAIIYGPKQESTPAFIPINFFDITGATSGSTIYKLKGEVLEGTQVMIRDMQWNPLRNKILHVDLYAPDMTGSLVVEVDLDFQGEPYGVTEEEGVVQEVRRTIELECPVTDIPESIAVDISEMRLNDTLQIADIKVPEKYKVISAPEYAVINVTEVRALAADEEDEAAEGEEGAEGASEDGEGSTEGEEGAEGGQDDGEKKDDNSDS